MELKNKREEALWGFIVGDALGVPYEFTGRDDMAKSPAFGMVGLGTHNQPVGTWSDDTSMMLCVLENLKNNGKPRDLAKLFIRWYDEGYHTPHGVVFDIGNTTREALEKLSVGISVTKSGSSDERAAGNGSLMRCLPYAFEENFPKAIFEMIFDNNITHRLSICNQCCFFYAKVIQAITMGRNKADAVKAGVSYLKFGRRIVDVEEDDVILAGYSKFDKIFSKDFGLLPENEIKSTGYVLRTLEAVMWCFLNSSNYREAVLKAVNLGGDTDTIAALTGGVAATYYGKEIIPQEWLNQIAGKHELERFFLAL